MSAEIKPIFWELTPDQQERLQDRIHARIQNAIKKAVRAGWDAAK